MADRVVMMSAEQVQREELAQAMKEMAANPLSETVPGGEYLNAAGERVNAHGHLLGSAEGKAEAREAAAAAEREQAAANAASEQAALEAPARARARR